MMNSQLLTYAGFAALISASGADAKSVDGASLGMTAREQIVIRADAAATIFQLSQFGYNQWRGSMSGSLLRDPIDHRSWQAEFAIKSFSLESNIVGDSITGTSQEILVKTANANNAINAFDGAVQLGPATANVGSARTLTSGHQSNSVEDFTATAIEAAITTAASPALASIAHSGTTIGVNISGAEYPGGGFPSASDLRYLKSKGVSLIRLPISWEEMQNSLGGPLNSTYLAGLQSFLDAAAARGMRVIVDLHNYGRYNPGVFANGVASTTILPASQNNSSSSVLGRTIPISALADLWGKLATALNGHAGLAGYDIMNEPHNMPRPTIWPQAAQAAVNAIRSVDVKTTIYVEGDGWASARDWLTNNANLHIADPANNLVYEAHVYFDRNGSGNYTQTYDQQGANPNVGVADVQPFLRWLQQNNAKGFVGEFGVPGNDPRWITVLNNFMNALQAAGVSATYWNYRKQAGWWPNPLSLNPISGIEQPQMAALFQHTQPVISSFSPNSDIVGPGITNTNRLTLTGTGAANSTIKVFDGMMQLGTATVDANGAWSFTTSTLVEGTHSFTATNVDAGGNISRASAALVVTVDTVAPR